ncbi:MAG: hypothetical protein D6714_07620, partial [Bacteroidetes bacterium]
DSPECREEIKKRKLEGEQILESLPKDLVKEFASLTDSVRNDINHGGFRKSPKKAGKIRKKLEESYCKIKAELQKLV